MGDIKTVRVCLAEGEKLVKVGDFIIGGREVKECPIEIFNARKHQLIPVEEEKPLPRKKEKDER